eukprot:2573658-Amphidinium_carterae.1
MSSRSASVLMSLSCCILSTQVARLTTCAGFSTGMRFSSCTNCVRMRLLMRCDCFHVRNSTPGGGASFASTRFTF